MLIMAPKKLHRNLCWGNLRLDFGLRYIVLVMVGNKYSKLENMEWYIWIVVIYLIMMSDIAWELRHYWFKGLLPDDAKPFT